MVLRLGRRLPRATAELDARRAPIAALCAIFIFVFYPDRYYDVAHGVIVEGRRNGQRKRGASCEYREQRGAKETEGGPLFE